MPQKHQRVSATLRRNFSYRKDQLSAPGVPKRIFGRRLIIVSRTKNLSAGAGSRSGHGFRQRRKNEGLHAMSENAGRANGRREVAW